MAGDVANPRIWSGADVYVADVGTTAPTDIATAWAAGWEAVGLLDGDAGMTESREEDQVDHFAWGGVLVRTTRSKHKRTITVTALEDNAVVFGLVQPGSEAETTTGITTRTVIVPTTDPRAFGLELVDGDITKRRVIPRGEIVSVGEISLNDSELAAYELTINIYPDAEGVLYLDITDDPQAVVAP
jgi:hypothetical protein